MANDVDNYLRELRDALSGADPALIQDALFDAEEHLRSEMADEASGFAAVVEAYGTPREVATAYLEGLPNPPRSPEPPQTTKAIWQSLFGVVADPLTYKSLVYMLLSLGTGIAFFTIVVTGLSLSAGLMVLIVGIPVLVAFLGAVRGLSFLEGRLVEVLLDTRMPRRPWSDPKVGFVQRIWFWLKDGRTWLAMVYMVLQLPLGVAYFTMAVTGLAVSAWLVIMPFVQVALGHTYININDVDYLFAVWTLPFLVVAGAILFVLVLHLIRGIGRLHARYAKSMLVRLAK